MTEHEAADLAEFFRTLGDASRIQILSALAQDEHHVGSLAALAGLSETATSHHLRHLRQMRIVRTRKEGDSCTTPSMTSTLKSSFGLASTTSGTASNARSQPPSRPRDHPEPSHRILSKRRLRGAGDHCGMLTNSVAILSDALHDFGDAIALGMAWRLEHYAQRPAAGRFSYGFGRFSLLAALINALILIGGSVFILTEAIPRLLAPEPTNAPGMIALPSWGSPLTASLPGGFTAETA